MNIAPTRWYSEGPFRVLEHPLASAPCWSTFWVYVGQRVIGRQLSKPSLLDCEYMARRAAQQQPIELQWQGYKRQPLRGVAKRRRKTAEATA